MNNYETKKLRTVAVIGHPFSGKTSFIESMLFLTGTKKQKGSVEARTTTSDYSAEEQEHQTSIQTSLIPIEYNGYKFNFLDTPGSHEFISEVRQSLFVVKGAVLMVDCAKGFDIGTDQVLDELKEQNVPSIVFFNKMKHEEINVDKLVGDLKEHIGHEAIPFLYPIIENGDFKGYINTIEMKMNIIEGGKLVAADIPEELTSKMDELREMIVESVAMSDEDLLEKYSEGIELTHGEIEKGLREGVLNGDLNPVVFGDVLHDIGVLDVLNIIEHFLASPADLAPMEFKDVETGDVKQLKTDPDEELGAYVFKSIIDPFIGKISFVKVYSGTLKSGQKVMIGNTDTTIKVNALSTIRGKDTVACEFITAGDIGVITKINELETGHTLCDIKHRIIIEGPEIPSPTMYVAVHPKNKSDEDKISEALHKVIIEDPSFAYQRNPETAQLLIGGQGPTHIRYTLEKIKHAFGVEVETEEQKIVYRETIKKRAEAEGKHKKQSGGSGQFGVVTIIFEPIDPNLETFVFEEQIHGGVVPRGYFPAVEKGLKETFEKGPLAGFPVIGVKATLIDGKYHDVDSNEISFKIAASLAFKAALPDAKPTLLEPIIKMQVVIKDEYLGDVMGDLNKRRGNVLGMIPTGTGKTILDAYCPEAEITSYTVDLMQMTQGTGSFTRSFDHYQEVPEFLIDDVVKKAKLSQE
jgi:elongation factor G